MYDVGGKLSSGIKSMYVSSIAYLRVKGGESECFRIDRGERKVCLMAPWIFNVYYLDRVLKEVKMGIE